MNKMDILRNYSLKEKNTFAIDAKAKLFVAPKSIDELKAVLANEALKKEPLLVLGGGSNILFISDFDGLIIYPSLCGKEIVMDTENEVWVKANAAEDWDEFVSWTVDLGYGGLENLSLIPGSVGACPVQNIGAYGVEVAEVIENVKAVEISTQKLHEFSNEECEFGYRNSVFKNKLKGKFIITSVTFKLQKHPEFKTHYGAVNAELEKIGDVSLSSVRQAVINIRESKLPKPEVTPNAGSFFKNPVVGKEKFKSLEEKYPEIVAYKADDVSYKLAAGWMIDYLGWKGKTFGGAAVHEKQALVLVNKKKRHRK
jgi:UDP-N-acetylmuramate dehydrogenase